MSERDREGGTRMLGFGPKGYFMTLGVRAGGNLHLILMKLMTILFLSM